MINFISYEGIKIPISHLKIRGQFMKFFHLIILICFSVLVYGEEMIDESLLLFRVNCSACHLDSGHGVKALNVASIAGLPRWYVSKQVRHFRDGKRGAHLEDIHGKLMRDLAKIWIIVA